MPLGPFLVFLLFFTPPSGRCLVIPIFFPWFFFLVVTCPRPLAFARPNKYSSCLSLHRQGLLSWVTVTYVASRGGRTTAGSNAPGAFLVHYSLLIFFGGHLPQTSGYRSAKQTLVASFATPTTARFLSDRNIFCTLGEGQQRRGLMPLGHFFFFGGQLPQTSLAQTNTRYKLPVNLVNIGNVFSSLGWIR